MKQNLEKKDIYLLWGNDAEMQHIKKKLDKNNQEYIDKNLWWWANIEAYNDDIKNILQNWNTPVWIELTWANQVEWVVDIDHHNEKAHMPAAIIQVIERLWLKMLMYDELIAANDSWFIPEMESKIDEHKERITEKLWEEWFEKVKKNLIANVRKKDRFAQWITKEQEGQAEESIKNREDYYNWNLTIIRLPHGKWATVTDRLYWTYKNLLILSEDWEINFYWDWEMCQKLKDENEWSWAWWSWLWEKWGDAFWGWYVDQWKLEWDVKNEIKDFAVMVWVETKYIDTSTVTDDIEWNNNNINKLDICMTKINTLLIDTLILFKSGLIFDQTQGFVNWEIKDGLFYKKWKLFTWILKIRKRENSNIINKYKIVNWILHGEKGIFELRNQPWNTYQHHGIDGVDDKFYKTQMYNNPNFTPKIESFITREHETIYDSIKSRWPDHWFDFLSQMTKIINEWTDLNGRKFIKYTQPVQEHRRRKWFILKLLENLK